MTVTGKLLITVYSIVVLLFIIIREFKKGDKGWNLMNLCKNKVYHTSIK